ncbi:MULTISPECIES: hypothetical protein [unclassified Micromonospora]|nr:MULTISPECIES: hypothetical protein [unclassified Micromonospora]
MRASVSRAGPTTLGSSAACARVTQTWGPSSSQTSSTAAGSSTADPE